MAVYPYAPLPDRPDATPTDGPDPYGDPDPEWLRTDWREHLRTIELEGASVNCVDAGEGEPVIMVHGLGGCWQNWLENILALTTAGHRVVALDLPGFGRSPMPRWEISIPRYAEMLDELRAELDLEGATLVGNSMGGFIAAESARRRADWVSRLVLVSPAGISHATHSKRPAQTVGRVFALIAPVAARLTEAAIRRPGLRGLTLGPTFHHPDHLPRELLWEFYEGGSSPPGFLPALVALTGYDFLDHLGDIEVPTLIVWGREDVTVPCSDAPGYVERIPNARLELFADCGHVPMAERPVRFNRTLARFIDETRSAPRAHASTAPETGGDPGSPVSR
jgi:pimeloyl-ACP methyl ester carboxylesterase